MINLFEKTTPNINFNTDFFTKHLITYIGNKRSLLPFLNTGFEFVRNELGKNKLFAMDGFGGSGVVSRLLKQHCETLHTNDIENYSYIINTCYLSNKSEVDAGYIKGIIDYLNNLPESSLIEGFITKNYTPKDDYHIKMGERVYYTHHNGMIIDTIKKFIFTEVPEHLRPYILAPLLVQASIHTNTSGVFKGFHKKEGIGHFGGKGENALTRIKGQIKLEYPAFSNHESKIKIFKDDINHLIKQPEHQFYDLVYYDPPYNQHPYGSNYFMLNIIASPEESTKIQDGVCGISVDWYKSSYNKKQQATLSLDDLIKNTNSKYILMSYNNEGIIPFDVFKETLERYGTVSMIEQEYNTYRGCRNLNNRNIKVKELLWILKKT